MMFTYLCTCAKSHKLQAASFALILMSHALLPCSALLQTDHNMSLIEFELLALSEGGSAVGESPAGVEL